MVMIDDDLGMSSVPFPDLAAGPRASGSAPPCRAVSMLLPTCAQDLVHLKRCVQHSGEPLLLLAVNSWMLSLLVLS